MNKPTIIAVNETYQIEVLNGTFYPMLKTADGKRFCYFNKGNKQESRKTEKGAGDFIRAYMTRMGTPERCCDRCSIMTDEYRVQSGETLCEKCIRELECNAQPMPMTFSERLDAQEQAEETAACNMQWKRLLATTPSYVSRNLSNTPMFFEASDEYKTIEAGIAQGDFQS